MLKTRTNAQCMEPFTEFPKNQITSNMICAHTKDKSACSYDSGGPLSFFDQADKHWTLIGVTSFVKRKRDLARSCANNNAASVFARVTAQLKWILSHVSGQTCPRPE